MLMKIICFTYLKLDIGEHEIRRTVEVEADKPRMGGVDECLHVAAVLEIIENLDGTVEIPLKVLIEYVVDEVGIAHICSYTKEY